jgi:hypothetical protein
MKPQGTRQRLAQSTVVRKRRQSAQKGAATTARRKGLTDALDQFFKPLR